MKIIPKGYVREKNNNPVSFDTEGNLVDLITNEKGTMVLPEITVRGISPETKYRNYSSAYHPESSLEFFDIMTRPLTRPFSISLLIGAVRNKINGGTYWGSLLGNEENLGIVSKNFNEKHPYLSTAANIGIDILTPFAVGSARRINKGILDLTKYNRIYKINKELNKGIKENSIIESYNKIAANKDIGTAYDYLDFLDNIFPKSKMTGVYYHGGPKGITLFESAKSLGKTNKGINSGTKDYGIYFADDKVLANYYANTNPKSNRELYTVKLNMTNPIKIKTNNWYLDNFVGTLDFAFNPGSITLKWYDKLNLKLYNSIYHNGKSVLSDGEIVMFNPLDIHIMGTPQESAMFREYKKFPIKHLVLFNENIPIMLLLYDFGFKNIIKAAKPGIILGGVSLSPFGLAAYAYRDKEKRKKKTKIITENSKEFKE